MTNNTQIMSEARASLDGKWPLAIGTFLILLLISMGAALIPYAGQVITILMAGPLAVGAAFFALNIVKDQAAKTDDLFFSFNNNLGNSILAYLLVLVFAFIGFILLIIPGIIVALALSQTWFILAENPSMDSYDAIIKSKNMMKGYKWQYFKIGLRLFGLGLLCLLTLGVGFLWLIPYQYVVYAKFYEEVKAAN
tara:strand:- start:207 stop:788 length:582 start_codon:yes stop_codon:yes gene_type:complete